ncbi:glycosyltransferase [Phascolarctobacterium succinatutens]|uniref:glycosyltransferase n=1 Tax=Phascolarctobacterium succinatutens TaxID=626940 RepID=UPI00307EEE9B
MRILMVNLWKMINSAGGAEKVFCEMANMLSERGHSVTAIAFDKNKGKPFYAVNENVKFINSGQGCKLGKNWWQKIRASFYSKNEKELYSEEIYDDIRAKRLAPFVNEKDFDVIISYNPSATRILIHKLKVKIPIITMFNVYPETILKDMSYLTKIALEKCSVIQVLLPSYVNITRKYIDNKMVVIPNIVPQYSNSDCHKEKCIVNVARIDGQTKRQILLIEAFNKIKTKHPDWKLEFWGDIDYDKKYYKKCQNMISHYKLSEQAFFRGATNNVLNVYNKAAIFAFPSAYEGFGLALTEAMSAGLPAVGCKSCPAVNELIKDGENGFLCEDGVDAFAQALEKLMIDEELREKMGKAAKEDMKQYAPDKIWDMWEKLIEQVAKGKL